MTTEHLAAAALRRAESSGSHPAGGHPAGERSSAYSFLRSGERRTIAAYLHDGRSLALLLFEIENFRTLGDVYGATVAERIAGVAKSELGALCAEYLGCCSLLYVESVEPGQFLVLCGSLDPEEGRLSDLSQAFRLRLRTAVRGEALSSTGQSLEVLVGYAQVRGNGGSSLEHLVFAALSDARRVARGALSEAKLSLLKEFRDIVAGGRLQVVYQPIVNLDSGDILAWEALTRGPADSNFASPAVLFDFAEEVGEVFALERACRENALHEIGRLDQEQKLFLNVNPHSMADPGFTPGETLRLLARYGLRPSDVVLEITERHSVRDFDLFHRTLEHYRSQGFLVAVDDVGAGYSGLWNIAEIRPDYIKVDQALVRDLESHRVKRALMETFVAFAEKIGCRLIAEGIETEAELATVMRLGVHYGQGFHLRRPTYPKPGLAQRVQHHFANRGWGAARADRRFSAPVRGLAEATATVPPTATVDEVRRLLGEGGPTGSVVVVEDGRPLGLVMGHHLDRALSSRYGVALYLKRPVSLVMDPSPLTAEAATPVENVAREAMNRKKSKVFDHVVVTERGCLVGIVTVQEMLDSLASAQVEMAKGANPLTGLPGNVAIEQEMERRCREGRPFAIVYADLDNFKVYNDTYGFKKGDEIILLLAKAMGFALRRHGHAPLDFLGHIGGDDLVAMCEPARAERISRSVTRIFGRLVRRHYTPQDAARGWIRAKDRSGEERDFPLVSVSLAIVDCSGACDLAVLAQRAAEMKKYAKSFAGNSFVRDRRSPAVPPADPGATPPAPVPPASDACPLPAPSAAGARDAGGAGDLLPAPA